MENGRGIAPAPDNNNSVKFTSSESIVMKIVHEQLYNNNNIVC